MNTMDKMLLVGGLLLVGCGGAAEPGQITSALDEDEDEGRGVFFSPSAHPYDKSLVKWSEAWWRWVLSIPLPENPLTDATGAHCAVHQHGPVWFLADGTGPTSAPSCTLPAGHAVLVNMRAGILNDYPCPDPNFHPAPGQSLQDFLTQGIKPLIDAVSGLSVSVDGHDLADPTAYRLTTPLFEFKGDPSLLPLDACITGRRQPGVSDGYWVMLKPLHPGTHTVHVTAATPGTLSDLTWHLTVTERDDD